MVEKNNGGLNALSSAGVHKKERKEMVKKKKIERKIVSLYTIFGNSRIKRNNPHCPRCGVGTFLARHAWGFSCGKCGDRYPIHST